ncbi:hypothetical protein ACJD0Z_17585 [Flavobacteriaceae bacterium M23B6Z8]
MQKTSLYILIVFFFIAGVYHFMNPQFYLPLIPDYLPFPEAINLLSGTLEIVFALLLIPVKTRKSTSMLICVLLIAFIPSHIYFIHAGSCFENSICVAPWIAWIRLLVIHPLLIYWTWYAGNLKTLKS